MCRYQDEFGGFKYLVGYGKCVRYVTSEEGEYIEGFFFWLCAKIEFR